ncbi:hypothetical protein ACF1AL_14995 [Streptomyces sp. NPDC014801]|uniref:hypothetical protein n=1 Tax=Streptomyces sp. NPDC014801 TaxID=3364916 RepID=UPI0036FDB0AC
MNDNPRAGRYHLLLAVDGRPALHGWWNSETTARGQFRQIVGSHGRDGARVTLTDEETGTALTTWPGEG